MIAFHLQKQQDHGHWEPAQPAPLTLLWAKGNPFASQVSQPFTVGAAEILRTSDFRGHSLGMMRLCRKKTKIPRSPLSPPHSLGLLGHHPVCPSALISSDKFWKYNLEPLPCSDVPNAQGQDCFLLTQYAQVPNTSVSYSNSLNIAYEAEWQVRECGREGFKEKWSRFHSGKPVLTCHCFFCLFVCFPSWKLPRSSTLMGSTLFFDLLPIKGTDGLNSVEKGFRVHLRNRQSPYQFQTWAKQTHSRKTSIIYWVLLVDWSSEKLNEN